MGGGWGHQKSRKEQKFLLKSFGRRLGPLKCPHGRRLGRPDDTNSTQEVPRQGQGAARSFPMRPKRGARCHHDRPKESKVTPWGDLSSENSPKMCGKVIQT